jgi:uncharacterized protein (TIGR03435 family)
VAPVLVEAQVATAVGQAAKVPEWQTAAGGAMSFDVASIRPTKPGEFTPPNFAISNDDSYRPVGGSFIADFPLETYIEFAYKIRLSPEQRRAMLATVPAWVGSEGYEVHAKVEGNPTKDQMRLMMQALMAERFGLKIHFETREIPVLRWC